MFVVKRPFKNMGVVMEVGSVVDPASTKLFKPKLHHGKIVEVTEQNYNEMKAYFKGKFGVDIPAMSSGDTVKPKVETKASAKTENKASAKTAAKTAAKATAKPAE